MNISTTVKDCRSKIHVPTVKEKKQAEPHAKKEVRLGMRFASSVILLKLQLA